MMHLLQTGGTIESLLGSQDLPHELGFADLSLRLAFACGLGFVVAGIYWFSTRHRARTPGLFGALVLLAMLIAFVTLAVGDNAAKAFTLVGTLAIVRFRTAVRDIRDTAFVMFAVAVGIAIGAFNTVAAVAGTVVVGAAAIAVTWKNGGEHGVIGDLGGRLTIRLEGAGTSVAAVEPALELHARAHQLIVAKDGRDGGLRAVYAVDVDRERAPLLIDAVREIPGVRRVTLSFGDDFDDD